MKKAFTLVELLVVIGILSILTVTLMVSMRGGTESARSAKCLTNMKNLASAVQTCAMKTGYYPLAGSVEKLRFDESDGIRNVKKLYYELPGWLSWNSQGTYGSKPTSHAASSSWFTSAYTQDEDARLYCVTNGALWKFLSGNRDVFVCPAHQLAFPTQRPFFTYIMNEYFGWDDTQGSGAKSESYGGRKYGHLDRADRRLLFAEMQWQSGYATTPNTSAGSGTACDCTLQYKDKHESIGFNHKAGRDKVAHIVFADGHTEKLTLPKRGLSDAEIQNLTKWLCEGTDVSFNGQRYEELK